MDFGIRQLPDFAALAIALFAQWWLARLLPRRRIVRVAMLVAMVWVAFGFLFGIPAITKAVPYKQWMEWPRAAAFLWGIVSSGMAAIEITFRLILRARKFDPGRRKLIGFVKAAAMAVPAVVAGYGTFVERERFTLKEVDIDIPGLPQDLDGLRIVQLTDIHFGPFFGRRDLARAVAMANEARADIAVVTGDLITVRSDSLDGCLDVLRGLRADAGLLGCHGNHEIVAGCQQAASCGAARFGLRILRGEQASLRFGSAVLNVAGVDYQRKASQYLAGAERLVAPGAFNILLSHNPDVFPVAAAKGFDLTISGHTHGGQINVEILNEHANVMRFFTPYIYGKYERGGRRVWVSRGLGTVGVPTRVGAPPEVALIRLCAT